MDGNKTKNCFYSSNNIFAHILYCILYVLYNTAMKIQYARTNGNHLGKSNENSGLNENKNSDDNIFIISLFVN